MRKQSYLALKAFVVLSALMASSAFSQTPWRTELRKYIDTKLAKSDGGYGWEDQPDSHLTPTFAVAGILYDLDALPKNRLQLAEFIRTHHPQTGPNKEAGPSGSQLRYLTYQQIQSILWLGGDAASFKDEVNGWKSQAGTLANYEEHGYPVLFQEMMTPVCRKLLNQSSAEIKTEFLAYLDKQRRANGSFNNAPASDGGDGNILNTYWALYALSVLQPQLELRPETIAWLQACQLKNGGFTHQPHPRIGSNDEVIYTWAAVKALQLLKAKPQNTSACISYLISLRNADGGFGNRPGIHSNPVSTFYAIDALKALDAFAYLDKAPQGKLAPTKAPDFSGYKVYTVQFQANGSGSPAEAVMLADSLKINLWGAKNAAPGWIEAAQKIAAAKNVPVTFFTADEPYNKNIEIPGMGSFGHILDYIAPANSNIHFSDNATFSDFKNTTLPALSRANGGLILQVSNNEPLARMLLDESIQNAGYLAISTIHFGQNFSFWLPYLNEYRYQLPFISLQDAHGTEAWWWSNELVNHRTLFIAQEPTYVELIKALKNNWVVAVRHDSLSNYQTRILGGADEARKFINDNKAAWTWWNDKTNDAVRPWAAVTILTPADKTEVARPEKGVNIRVRCWWSSMRESLRSPAVELQQLKVDGEATLPQLVTKKNKNGNVTDAYYLIEIANPAKGRHKVEALVKNVSNGATQTITAAFTQN